MNDLQTISPDFRIRHRKLTTLLVALVFLPVFLDRSGIFNSLSFSARGFPASLLLVTLLPFAVFLCRSSNAILSFITITFCVLLPTASFGIPYSEHFSLNLTMSYLSSLFVAFSVYGIINRLDPTLSLERLLLIGVYTIGIVTLFWVPFQASNVLSIGRANGSVWDLFVIYQVWVYWPTALAIAFCASFLASGFFLAVLRVFLFVGIFFTGAREPILFIFVFGIIFCLSTGRIKYFFFLIISGALFFTTLILYFNFYPDSLIALKFNAMISGQSSLDGGRFEVLNQFKLSKVNFFWGTGFSRMGVFGSPHNQYIEFYYRGGVFGLIVSFILLLVWLRSFRNSSKVAWSIFGTLLIVTNVVNTPIRVPYTGTIIWVLFFFLVDTRRR